MATANVRFENVVVYNILKLDVKLGTKFQIELIDQPGETDWFSNADEVLEIRQVGNLADVIATAAGTCKIKIEDLAGKLILMLTITVVDAIPLTAAKLDPKAGTPEQKP